MRRRLSTLHPWLYSTRVAELRLERRVADRLRRVRFARHIAPTPLPVVLVHHSSVLRRQLLDLDPRLQESKIVNLRLAVASIDGLVIGPGETFSFWERIGQPTAARGAVPGLHVPARHHDRAGHEHGPERHDRADRSGRHPGPAGAPVRHGGGVFPG